MVVVCRELSLCLRGQVREIKSFVADIEEQADSDSVAHPASGRRTLLRAWLARQMELDLPGSGLAAPNESPFVERDKGVPPGWQHLYE